MSWSALRRSPSALAGLAIISGMAALALLSIEWPALALDPLGVQPRSILSRYLIAYSPAEDDLSIDRPPTPPDGRHWFGTDVQRFDLLSRVLHGSKISLQVGLAAEAIALLIGVGVGALAGFYEGRLGALLMRVADIVLALPLPIIAMAAIAVFERPSLPLIFAVLGLVGWAGIARLVRAQFLSVKRRGFSEAARALGAGDLRLIVRHILPEAFAPALVAAAAGVAGNILTEAWLSFLGLGPSTGTVSWGRMIADGRHSMGDRWWLWLFPGVALSATVLGFVLLADGLRDALDPRARSEAPAA